MRSWDQLPILAEVFYFVSVSELLFKFSYDRIVTSSWAESNVHHDSKGSMVATAMLSLPIEAARVQFLAQANKACILLFHLNVLFLANAITLSS